MNYKYDVFLSYSSYDNNIVSLFKNELEKNDISYYTADKIEVGYDFKQSIEQAIISSEFFIFICSSEFLRQHHSNLFGVGDANVSHVETEIQYASKCALYNAVKIIPIVVTRRFGDEKITSLICDLFDENTKTISGANIQDVSTKVIDILNKNQKKKDLLSEAEQARVYGAYEQAYNKYLSLSDFVEGQAKLICYDRAADCCEKAGKWEEAKKLYHFSNNEQALKRLENNTKSKETIKPKEVNQELLYKIANYCDASIDLFYELLKDNQSPEGLNCLKTSYTRLLNYCKTIGGMDDVISSALLKMKESEKNFSKGNLVTKEVKNDIIKTYRTYLGLEFPESDNYDVFISYKSEDEMLARRVYDYLLGEGKRVFFACEVLPDMGKTEYRDAIMDALDHSQHFVLVTSKLDYITSNWVKEEWSFYVSKLIEDNHKGNLAIIIHDDFKIDKNQLPPNLRYKQRLLMSNFKESLLKYLQQ